MGRRDKRRKPTMSEKTRKSEGEKFIGRHERIEFGDLSRMTQGVVADIAKRMRCTKEEIVEVLNDGR